MTDTPPVAFEPFASRCREAGFDIVHPFRVDTYNKGVEAPLRLPDFGRTAALGLLVGNTRFLWDVFLRALRLEPSRLEGPHPLDRYAMDRIRAAAKTLDAVHTIRWAHDAPPAALPVQRIAHAAGLAWLSPSHLSVHPIFGPWLAFRAVIVVNEESSLLDSKPAPDPCTRCPKPCLAELARAVAGSRSLDQSSISEHFDIWRRVRDVCPEGGEHRYGEEQLRYHYTKAQELLLRLAGAPHQR
jgi:methylmalonic aciduria homocystinuria type C protein